ncbi:hypothetical protein [Algoriphagus boritolerans]
MKGIWGRELGGCFEDTRWIALGLVVTGRKITNHGVGMAIGE